MPDLRHLIQHWGYLAICASILLGNLGVPVPEESTLVWAGYLWCGRETFGSHMFSSWGFSVLLRAITSAIGSGGGTGKRP
jgi:membrane protein DedA with SNARE-associated domain